MAPAIYAPFAAGDAFQQERAREAHVLSFFEKEATLSTPIYRGWARLFLNRDLAQGNADLRAAYADILSGIGKGAREMTPKIAGDEGVKWQMRNWIRIYFSFYGRGRTMPGRLEPETQRLMHNLFWNYVCDKSNFRRAQPHLATDVQGSENHEMMHYSNVLMALQALHGAPDYRERKLPDGRTVREHFMAWNAYYTHHGLARGMYGDQVELFAAYWKYTMPELLNMCDLAEDALLRNRIRLLLDVLWTDWAIGQLGGVRGGCRTRIYQSKTPDGGELDRGQSDPWRWMSGILLDRDNWWACEPWWHPDPIRGDARVLAMTRYRPPAIVRALIDDPARGGEYVFVARRPGQQRVMRAAEVPVVAANTPWYALNTNDTRMLSYEYCTPDFVMGALIIDPTLKIVSAHAHLEGNDLAAGYPSLTAQNRYHSIQFATAPEARVVPQCWGRDNGKTYNQQQAVQHKNMLLVQRNKNGKGHGALRVYFARGMKARLAQRDGWFFLQEGKAYLAVKGFARDGSGAACDYEWDNEFWLRPQDPDAPVALIAGRQARFGSLDAFMTYVGAMRAHGQANTFTLSGKDTEGAETSLVLYTDMSRIPEVNRQPVNFTPANLYDSPFLFSKYGSGIVTIQKDGRRLVLDFPRGVSTY